VGDIISGVGLGISGWCHQALCPTARAHVWIKFYWKLDCNPSL